MPKRNIMKHFSLFVSALGGWMLAATAQAQEAADYFDPSGAIGANSGLPQTGLAATTFTVIGGFLQIIGVIALVLIIYGGFTWMTAAGNEQKVETGRNVLIWAAIGLLVIMSAFGILQFLDATFFGAESAS